MAAEKGAPGSAPRRLGCEVMKKLDTDWGAAPGPCLKETLTDLERIVAMKDPVLRNLWITVVVLVVRGYQRKLKFMPSQA